MKAGPYAERLRQVLDGDDWSQAKLAKALAEETGNTVDSEEKTIKSYLRGSLPRPPRAALLARVTGDAGLGETGRESASARIERRLEELGENHERMLVNQEAALVVLQELRNEIASALAALGNAPRQKTK